MSPCFMLELTTGEKIVTLHQNQRNLVLPASPDVPVTAGKHQRDVAA